MTKVSADADVLLLMQKLCYALLHYNITPALSLVLYRRMP